MVNWAPYAAMSLAVAVGAAFGVGGYTFVYARGASYLTNDPAACANCHVMQEHFDSWQKSSHRAVATCNDCHTPAGFVPKYLTKASNGFWHSFAFTTGDFPDPLRIKPGNAVIANDACRKCHGPIVAAIDVGDPHAAGAGSAGNETMSCVRCHGAVGHPMVR